MDPFFASMNCPYCNALLSGTAIRCKSCRKALAPLEIRRSGTGILAWAKGLLARGNSLFLEEKPVVWGLRSVLFFWVLAFAASWALEYQAPALPFLEFLREHFFIFTREPRLQHYLYIFLNTLILKTALTIAVLIFVRFCEKKMGEALAWRLPQTGWMTFTFVFFGMAVIAGQFEGINPLIPNLPTSFFFAESAVIGNAVALVSIIVIAPITEEIFFRGFMLPAIVKRTGALAGTLIVSVLFAAVHFPQLRHNYAALVVIFGGSVLMSLARLGSRSTIYAIGLHALYNASILGAGFFRDVLK